MNLSREEKIKLLQKRMKGEAVDLADLYTPEGPFIECNGVYYNDGYSFTQEQFQQVKDRLVNIPWLPSMWFLDSDDQDFIMWLETNSKPFRERTPGTVEQCTIDFHNKLDEYSSSEPDDPVKIIFIP